MVIEVWQLFLGAAAVFMLGAWLGVKLGFAVCRETFRRELDASFDEEFRPWRPRSRRATDYVRVPEFNGDR